MTAGMVEYVCLRLLRRFVFGDSFLLRFGRFVPYYRVNANQASAEPIVDLYSSALTRSGLPLTADRTILEVGSGATNSVGYELLRRNIAGVTGHIYLFEPHVRLDRHADDVVLKGASNDCLSRVERIVALDALPDHSIDLMLSNSVLEHVNDMDGLLASLKRVLKPAGCMIHSVDYRDHFFKYPYHFLLFPAHVWERWLNPGDLPRWRLGGHLRAFSAQGFSTEVLESRSLPDAFERIRDSISNDFSPDIQTVAVTSAVLLNKRVRGVASQ